MGVRLLFLPDQRAVLRSRARVYKSFRAARFARTHQYAHQPGIPLLNVTNRRAPGTKSAFNRTNEATTT